MSLQHRVALVTGGASGIGRAAAVAFAREGARVAIADINPDHGHEAVEQIAQAGGEALFIPTDVRSADQIRAMVAACVARFGRLDIAFNNAACSGEFHDVVDCTEDEWAKVMDINVTAIWRCMQAEIPEMLKQGAGAIVNTSSGQGLNAGARSAAYVTSKHAVIGLTKSAALDYAGKNIRVNCLVPGATLTPMLDTTADFLGVDPLSIGAGNPMGRTSTPEEQAEAAVWLCTDKASFVTGLMMVVDGGTAIRR